MTTIIRVTFNPRNKKCRSLKSTSYLVITDSYKEAHDKAVDKFKSENKNYMLYGEIIYQQLQSI